MASTMQGFSKGRIKPLITIAVGSVEGSYLFPQCLGSGTHLSVGIGSKRAAAYGIMPWAGGNLDRSQGHPVVYDSLVLGYPPHANRNPVSASKE